jgi:arsenate reductase
MKEVGIDITKQKSKTVRESLNEHFGYVVSIADTSRERSPIFPSTPNLLKWNEVDPAVALAADSDRLSIYRRVRDDIKAKVQGLVRQIFGDEQGMALRRTA